MKKITQFIEDHPILIILSIVIIMIIIMVKRQKEATESSYLPPYLRGAVSEAIQPRDTGNDIADIQLQRMSETMSPDKLRMLET